MLRGVRVVLGQMGRLELDNLVEFFRISGRLKRVPRSGWVEVGVTSPESVADHTFRTAVLCMIYSDLESLDGSKMLRMALIHDLPEVITGDLTPSKKTGKPKESEDAAMKQLLGLLPRRLRERYLQIWLEYVECKTKEAKAVRELDKLEMALQAKEYKKAQPPPSGLERFVESADRVVTSPGVRKLLSSIIDSSVEV
ncbi:MAG: HD domain-containing protein [Candidatus Bathyarchaeia archaeon]